MRDHVKGDVGIMIARRFDHLQRMLHGIMGRAVFGLDMADLQPRAGLPRGGDGLGKAQVILRVAVAHMGGVKAFVFRGHFAQRNQMVGRGQNAGEVFQPR